MNTPDVTLKININMSRCSELCHSIGRITGLGIADSFLSFRVTEIALGGVSVLSSAEKEAALNLGLLPTAFSVRQYLTFS